MPASWPSPLLLACLTAPRRYGERGLQGDQQLFVERKLHRDSWSGQFSSKVGGRAEEMGCCWYADAEERGRALKWIRTV